MFSFTANFLFIVMFSAIAKGFLQCFVIYCWNALNVTPFNAVKILFHDYVLLKLRCVWYDCASFYTMKYVKKKERKWKSFAKRETEWNLYHLRVMERSFTCHMEYSENVSAFGSCKSKLMNLVRREE